MSIGARGREGGCYSLPLLNEEFKNFGLDYDDYDILNLFTFLIFFSSSSDLPYQHAVARGGH